MTEWTLAAMTVVLATSARQTAEVVVVPMTLAAAAEDANEALTAANSFPV